MTRELGGVTGRPSAPVPPESVAEFEEPAVPAIPKRGSFATKGKSLPRPFVCVDRNKRPYRAGRGATRVFAGFRAKYTVMVIFVVGTLSMLSIEQLDGGGQGTRAASRRWPPVPTESCLTQSSGARGLNGLGPWNTGRASILGAILRLA